MATGGDEQVAVNTGERSSNYVKVGQLLIDTGGDILRHIIEKLVNDQRSQSTTFREFLNERRIRCELFHLRNGQLCCVCRNDLFSKILKENQWEMLYQIFLTEEERICPINTVALIRNENHCCVYEAKPNLPHDLDISIMCFLILGLSDFNSDGHLKYLIRRIREQRNIYSHMPSTHMTDERFEYLFEDIGKILRELARFCRNERLISDVRSKMENRGSRASYSQENVDTMTNNIAAIQKIERILNRFKNGIYDKIQEDLDVHCNNENERQMLRNIIHSIEHFLDMKEDLETQITRDITQGSGNH